MSEASENNQTKFRFSEKFMFGAASSAYQVEGAWNIDGRTPSIWDTFTHNYPDLILDKSNGDVSADSYHFFENDIQELKQIGVNYKLH